MPVPLFANKPERCPFGHSLARGKPQKIGWMPCICGPARERAAQGRGGMGHLWVRCLACSDVGHRETIFYEPPHDTGHQAVSSWATRPGTLPNFGLIVGLRRRLGLRLRVVPACA
jgi:hypothetical protein